jgi:cytochrome b6
VGITEADKVPLVGTFLANLARGGPEVTLDTLGRFFTLHVTVLPITLLALIGVHLLFIQIQGMSEPDSFAALPPEAKKYEKFFSEFIFAEIPIWLALSAVLVALSAVWPRPLAPEANPAAAAPVGIKPEWYYLSQFQWLKLFPGRLEMVGMAILGVIPLGIVAVPFLDRSIPTDDRGRLVTRLGIFALLALLVLTIWGALS